MSYLSQMLGLAFHNFTSAATGIAIAAALVRGIARHSTKTLGNFWVDLVRVTYYLLLPICLVFAVFLVSQGMIQNVSEYKTIPLLVPGVDGAGKAAEMEKESGKIVKFGTKPVILVRTADDQFRAFSAVCTHLDCTVQFNKDMKKEAEQHPELELLIADGQDGVELRDFLGHGAGVGHRAGRDAGDPLYALLESVGVRTARRG